MGPIYSLVGAAAGAAPNILHVPSDAIVAADPGELGSLFGDKIYSTVFDNSKLRSVVPGYRATVPFATGITETIAWFDADPARQAIDEAANRRLGQTRHRLPGCLGPGALNGPPAYGPP